MGYQYKRGTSNNGTISVITDPGIGNEGCSARCTNATRCAAYEYFEYNSTYKRTCKLFSTSETTTDSSSGFHHCERLGVYINLIGISHFKNRKRFIINNDLLSNNLSDILFSKEILQDKKLWRCLPNF